MCVNDLFFECKQCHCKITEFDIRLNLKLYKGNKSICGDCLTRNESLPPYCKRDFLMLFINYLFPSFFFLYFTYNLIKDNDNCFYFFREIFLHYLSIGESGVRFGEIMDWVIFPISALSVIISLILMLPFFESIRPEPLEYTGFRLHTIGELSHYEDISATFEHPILFPLAIIFTILVAILKMALGGIIFTICFIGYSAQSIRWKKTTNVSLIKKYIKVLKDEEFVKKIKNPMQKKYRGDTYVLSTKARKYERKATKVRKAYSYLSAKDLEWQIWKEKVYPPLPEMFTNDGRYYLICNYNTGKEVMTIAVNKKDGQWSLLTEREYYRRAVIIKRSFDSINKIYKRYANISFNSIINAYPWDFSNFRTKFNTMSNEQLKKLITDNFIKVYISIND